MRRDTLLIIAFVLLMCLAFHYKAFISLTARYDPLNEANKWISVLRTNRNIKPQLDIKQQEHKVALNLVVPPIKPSIDPNTLRLKGVHPSEHNKYLRDEFECFNARREAITISKDRINDDYCDCADGTDEPGTSACLLGRFYCDAENKYVPSSMVNDGIADCKDWSDEWLYGLLPH
eukprot:TRINITY_DN2714_c0_g1_i4.p1 TRINITY_DN2714_c0_g1~~TRINITY_DN2714_c0_g1_i4.p1  ORF type:complete len:194 (+),score=23.75 TRINITY_DN2714_c0_g1_i4:57-584(+)